MFELFFALMMGLLKVLIDAFLKLLVGNDHKFPRLGVSHRRGMVGCLQDLVDLLLCYRGITKMVSAHIPSGFYDFKKGLGIRRIKLCHLLIT